MTEINSQVNEETIFKDLGVVEPLCLACEAIGWKTPTPIQCNALPEALAGNSVVPKIILSLFM